MNTRTVIYRESAENINLKKEIDYLSNIIKNHKTQEMLKLQRSAQFQFPRVFVTKSVSQAGKVWPTHQSYHLNRSSSKLPFPQKVYKNPQAVNYLKRPVLQLSSKYKITGSDFTKRPQQTPNLQPSKYKLVKGQGATANVKKVSPAKSIAPKVRLTALKQASTSFNSLTSRQTSKPVFCKPQKTKYKVVNRNVTPKRTVFRKTPSRIVYSRPHSMRSFRRPQKYPFSSAFCPKFPGRWYSFKSFHRSYQTPTPRYKMKFCKKGTSSSDRSQIVSIGGLWYRASQTKLSRTVTPVNKRRSLRGSPRLITVMGVKYQMDSNGTALRRITPKGNGSPVSKNMSRIDMGGQTYMKNAAGLFVKTPITEKRIFASRAVSRSIYHLQMNNQRKAWRKNNQHCMFYVRFGKCHKGSKCGYMHDPDKVAVCTRFLRGTCKLSSCPFSHKISPDKMPVCSYFLQGRCSSDNCPYRHVKVNPSAGICKNFLKGYCPQGNKCKERHVTDCPDLSRGGSCSKKDCPFMHRKRKASSADRQKEPIKRTATRQPPKLEVAGQKKGTVLCDRSRDVGSLPSFIALPSISPEVDSTAQEESGKSELLIRPRFLKL